MIMTSTSALANMPSRTETLIEAPEILSTSKENAFYIWKTVQRRKNFIVAHNKNAHNIHLISHLEIHY